MCYYNKSGPNSQVNLTDAGDYFPLIVAAWQAVPQLIDNDTNHYWRGVGTPPYSRILDDEKTGLPDRVDQRDDRE